MLACWHWQVLSLRRFVLRRAAEKTKLEDLLGSGGQQGRKAEVIVCVGRTQHKTHTHTHTHTLTRRQTALEQERQHRAEKRKEKHMEEIKRMEEISDTEEKDGQATGSKSKKQKTEESKITSSSIAHRTPKKHTTSKKTQSKPKSTARAHTHPGPELPLGGFCQHSWLGTGCRQCLLASFCSCAGNCCCRVMR